MPDKQNDKREVGPVPVMGGDPAKTESRGDGRRRFLKGAVATAPVIMTLASRPVLGMGAKCWSGHMSGNASPHQEKMCRCGKSPGGYKNRVERHGDALGWPEYKRITGKGYDTYQGKEIDPGVHGVYTREDVCDKNGISFGGEMADGLNSNGTLETTTFYYGTTGGNSSSPGGGFSGTQYGDGLKGWFQGKSDSMPPVEGTKFEELFSGGAGSGYAGKTLMQVLWHDRRSFEPSFGSHAIAVYFNSLNIPDYVMKPGQALEIINSILAYGTYTDDVGYTWTEEEMKAYFNSTYE